MTIIKSIISFCLIGLCTLLTAQNPTIINGSIALQDDVIAALTAQHGQNWLNTGMGFELWSVVYRDVATKEGVTMTRVYLNEKQGSNKITKSIGTAPSGKSINFMVNGVPQEGNFIVLYYFNDYPPQYKTFKMGSQLNDGTNRTGLHYATNAPLKIGANKKYGALSILPIGQSQTYAKSIYANTAIVEAFGWGDIVDFIEDVIGIAWAGGKSLAGVVVDAAGTITILSQVYGMSQALFADGYLPDYREITQTEYNWVNTKIFNGNLPAKSKIVITNLYGYDHRQFVFPTGVGIILMNLGKKGFSNPLGKMVYKADPNEQNGEVFIHEMTHVWQIHTAADIKFVLRAIASQAGGASSYIYNRETCDNGKSWGTFNIEQQGNIVQHCYNYREDGNTASCQQQLVVANIRKGVAFPPPPVVRTPECVNLLNQITAKKREINVVEESIDFLEHGRIIPPDYTTPGGNRKPIKVPPPPNSAAKIREAKQKLGELKTQLASLNQRKTVINCQ